MINTPDASRFVKLRSRASVLDTEDSIRHVRDEFLIPTKADIKRKTLQQPNTPAGDDDSTACTYVCGNSLGLQPKRTAVRIKQFLETWAKQGVQGHFKPMEDSPLPPWLHVDDWAAKLMAPIVGAEDSEVAVMQTLTANLHLLMNAFYQPKANGRHKIILEKKAFPSDHYAVWSQVRQHGLSPETSVVFIEAQDSADELLSTDDIESVIAEHAKDTALILLPGVQYYTGQLLDIASITSFAHSHGVAIIWDLAHAVGNVPLSLHDWNVDGAAWCSYKYLNGGAGCIGGLFVHSQHSAVTTASGDPDAAQGYRHRLAGWWGNDKSTRFAMTNQFHPSSGAAGFQLSNPSTLDTTALGASLEVIAEAGGIGALRAKSLLLTNFLHDECLAAMKAEARRLFRCITPSDPTQRGAQLSLRLVRTDLLEHVLHKLEEHAVIIDERKPDVIRVTPCPLYNTFGDCVDFVTVFEEALLAADAATSASV